MDIRTALELLILAIASIASFLLGITVIQADQKSKTNIIFTTLAWVTTIWLVVNHLALSSNYTVYSLWLSRFSVFFAAPQIASVYFLAHTLPAKEINLKKSQIYFILAITLIVMATNLSPITFTGINITDGDVSPVPGPGMGLFALYALALSVNAIYTFISRYTKTSSTEKHQILFVMIGILAMFGLIIITVLLPVVLLSSTVFVPLTPLYALIFLGLTAYSIVQHNLFDLRVIATQVFVFLLWLVLFLAIFLAENTSERIVSSTVFTSVFIFGILLIRTVRKEFDQRQELEILTKRLQELSARKDEFISVAAHELRAPMTAIKGYLSMIQEGDAGKVTPKVEEFLDSALGANERLIRLVNNMLDVARIEEGRQTFEIGMVNLSEVAKEAVVSFKELANEKTLDFKLEIQANINDKVEVDKDRIHEVVTNLVSNAIKYTDTGAIVVRLKNNTSATVYFEVADTGAGLSNEEQGKLFTKFYRAESNTGKVMGTGLGLYVSKLLIEKFGGKIGVVSERKKGSTFWFELPVKQ
jgi:signal transduction histidine kinase